MRRLARRTFGADLRSLAVFRALLAILVLADLLVRAADLRAFYTDAGIVPRAVLLDRFAWLLEMPLCLHLAGGSAWSQILLFSIQALAAICLLVGYRTRLAAFVSWMLLGSLQLRNLYIGLGADALLRMLLLWGTFLPLGARWSVDQRQGGAEPGTEQVASVATCALLVQVAFVYFGAGVAKLEVPAWREGTALSTILDDEVRVTAFGRWLGQHVELCAFLDRLVLGGEIAGPLLLLLPFAAVRIFAVALLVAMNAGFALALEVGLFPWVATAGALALLPGSVWRRVPAARVERALAWIASRWPGRPARPPAFVSQPPARALATAICAVLLAFVCLFNVGVIRDPAYRPPASIEWLGRSLFLQQAWKMFARPARRTGWIEIAGQLRDGRAVDLMAAGGRVPDLSSALRAPAHPPEIASRQYANERWRNFLSRAVLGTDTSTELLLYGRFLCREWNAAHRGRDQLSTFRLVWHVRELPSRPGDHDRRAETIWTHDCFG